MVALSDLTRVTQLYTEINQINLALGNFEAGGTIMQMTISGGPPPPLPGNPGDPMPPARMPTMVSTVGMNYPASMVEAIKAALSARQAAIGDELAGLGITGEPPAATAAASPAEPEARRR